jgi:hypothetical protein
MEMIEQIISEPQSAILNSIKAVNLFLAGVGSGKTFLGGIISYRFISEFPDCTGFIAANTFEQLNLSTLFRIREYWKSLGVTEWSKDNPGGMYISGKQPPSHFNTKRHNFESYNSIISFINGAIIFTGSLENSKAHEGKQFSWCILDETKDSREVDIKEIIIARLRQQGLYIKDGQLSHDGEDFNPLYILTSPARVDWINEWFSLDKYIQEISDKIYSDKTFFEKEFGNKFVTISSTYHNRRNLPSTYIQNIKDNNTEERFKALVYSNPFISTGGEFYSSFNRLKHVTKVKYDPKLPIHISFDQNTVPYNSASIWQIRGIEDIWYIDCIDEIALQNPRNSTEEVCEEFAMRYPEHKTGLFYYGDASGKARSTMNRDFKHHYEIVEFMLRRYLVNGSDRTMTKNPSVVKRRDFINTIFEEKKPIRISIDESCKYLIGDLMYLKQAIDGTKDKHIVTDKETGEKYQKYGHLSDGMDYILSDLFKAYDNG